MHSEALPRLAEGIVWDYDPRFLPEAVELLERPDLLLWTRPSPSKWASRVAYARWSEADAERGIDEVLAFFRARDRSFVWYVGPSSSPRDLVERLERRGLVRERPPGHLLAAELPLHDLRTNPDVLVVEARDRAELETYARSAHPEWSDGQVRDSIPERELLHRVYGDRAGMLLAYLDDALVGNAAWRDSTDGRAEYLTGAGTKPEFRGRGVYQTLVRYRTERGLARGCRYAVINARSDTSMPILLRRGFVDLGELPVLSFPE